MNLTVGSRPRHLEDGDLVAYMDHAMDRARHRWAMSHLNSCAECAARLQALQDRAGSVSAWLAGLDAPVSDERRALAMAAVERARFRRRPFVAGGTLAAAAMVALMLTVAFGTPPGRAWVNGAVERLALGGPRERATEAVPEVRAAQPAAAAADSAPASAAGPGEPGAATAATRAAGRPGLPPGMSAPVSFNPGGNYVLLQIDSRQREGAVTIWVQDSRQAEAQVVRGRTRETLVPLADGLHVRNGRTSRADYTVTVPTRYRFIRVKIGDEPETTIAVSRSNRAWLWTINLAGSGEE